MISMTTINGAHIEEQDAEVEDAPKALAIILAKPVQVHALPRGICCKWVACRCPWDALGMQRLCCPLKGHQESYRLYASQEMCDDLIEAAYPAACMRITL